MTFDRIPTDVAEPSIATERRVRSVLMASVFGRRWLNRVVICRMPIATTDQRSTVSAPEFTQYINPLLAALRKLGGAARQKQVFQTIARDMALSSDVLQERHGSGASRVENQIAWCRWYLVETDFIDGSRRGIWKLTEKGWTTELLTEEAIRDIVAEVQSKAKELPTDTEAEGARTGADELDVAKLKQLYESDNVAQAFLEHAASRKRNQGETNVDRVLQILRNDGHDVTRQQVISVFKSLEDCSCGQFVPGRRGWPSRFVWSTAMISVGRTAAGEQEAVEEFPEETHEVEEDSFWLTHSFHLRPDVTLELEFPADLTSQEAQRIARFVEALPFENDV